MRVREIKPTRKTVDLFMAGGTHKGKTIRAPVIKMFEAGGHKFALHKRPKSVFEVYNYRITELTTGSCAASGASQNLCMGLFLFRMAKTSSEKFEALVRQAKAEQELIKKGSDK